MFSTPASCNSFDSRRRIAVSLFLLFNLSLHGSYRSTESQITVSRRYNKGLSLLLSDRYETILVSHVLLRPQLIRYRRLQTGHRLCITLEKSKTQPKTSSPAKKAKKSSGGGGANNGEWTPEKKAVFMDRVVGSGYKNLDLGALAEEVSLFECLCWSSG